MFWVADDQRSVSLKNLPGTPVFFTLSRRCKDIRSY